MANDTKADKDRVSEVWSKFWEKEAYSPRMNPYEKYMWDAHSYWFEFFTEKLAGKKVLEVGVGTGKLLCLLAERGADVTGVDISEAAVRSAKQAFEQNALKARLEVASAFSLPYEVDSFDLTYALGLIEHFENDTDKTAIIDEMLKVTKPGGTVILTVPKRFSVYTPNRAFKKLTGRWEFGYEEEFTAKRLVEICARQAVSGISGLFPIDIYPPPFNFVPIIKTRQLYDRYLMVPALKRFERKFPGAAMKIAHLIGIVLRAR